MFANFTQLVIGRPAPGGGTTVLIEDVRVRHRERRQPHVERIICWCWIFIAVKQIAVIWAVWHYHVPIHQLWINFPTWLLGVLATAVYYGRTRRT